MENVKRMLARDRFAEHNGIELVEVAPGRATTRLEIGERHLNGVGIAHGGAVFGLADFAFAAASNSHGTVAVGISASICHVKAVTTGAILTAEAREVSINPKLATYLIEVRDGEGGLVASFQGMVYRKKESVPGD